MLYLLDANTLIDAKRDYYPVQRVPEFWEWLIFHGLQENIKIPFEVYREFDDKTDIDGNKDELAMWSGKSEVKSALLFEEQPDRDLVSRIIYTGYLPEPTDQDLKKMGRDPFLLAYALKDPENRCVVIMETSKPGRKTGSSRKVPDVGMDFNIRCLTTFEMIRELDFSTNWKNDKY